MLLAAGNVAGRPASTLKIGVKPMAGFAWNWYNRCCTEGSLNQPWLLAGLAARFSMNPDCWFAPLESV